MSRLGVRTPLAGWDQCEQGLRRLPQLERDEERAEVMPTESDEKLEAWWPLARWVSPDSCSKRIAFLKPAVRSWLGRQDGKSMAKDQRAPA